MNVITLQGGLGNQMFQYALGKRFEEMGVEVAYDRTRLSWEYNGVHDRSRPAYGLDEFETRVELVRPGLAGKYQKEHYGTDQVSFDPMILFKRNFVLSGYWQSEKYFPDNPEVLVSDFFPRGHMPEQVVKLSRDIHYQQSIGLQVRRGDYLQFQEFHGVLGKQYFDEGLNLCQKEGEIGNVFIWTDDAKWCRENFPQARIANTGYRAWDIFLMSQCDRLVISNSSFGWWGAWLGDHNFKKNGRRVIAPDKWFATDKIDSRDVVPDRWWKI